MGTGMALWMPVIVMAITMIIGFVAQTAYFKGVFVTKLETHERDIDSLQRNVVYRDTCAANVEATHSRLERLETFANGSLRK